MTSPRALLDDLLAGGSPAAGSGVAAALVAAMAASVVREAARRSQAVAAAAQAEKLRSRSFALAEADERAYRRASDLLVGGDDFELGRALDHAAEVPLQIATVAADVAALATHVAEEGDPSVRADAVGAAFLAEAAARAAAHLVEINLATRADDPRLHSARSLVASASAAAGTLADD